MHLKFSKKFNPNNPFEGTISFENAILIIGFAYLDKAVAMAQNSSAIKSIYTSKYLPENEWLIIEIDTHTDVLELYPILEKIWPLN